MNPGIGIIGHVSLRDIDPSSRISNVIGNVTRYLGYLIVLLYFDTFRIIFGGDGNE